MLFFTLLKESFGDSEFSIFSANSNDIDIKGISSDSRDISENYMFVALPGNKADGISFVQEAIASGAKIIVTEASSDFCNKIVSLATVVQVNDARAAYAKLIKTFYHRIDESFALFGVTGTNGKTSTTHYISHILNTCSVPSAVIGTLGGISPTVTVASERTTPDIRGIFEMFSVFGKNGIKAVAMEVSSHALELKRTLGLRFRIGVFTNLTGDHLDFHKTMASYLKAKQKLFDQADVALVNIDDEYGKIIAKTVSCKLLTYSVKDSSADYFAKDIIHQPVGTNFEFVNKNKTEYSVHIDTPGLFSVYNALAAIAVAVEYGISPVDACKALASMPRVPGRFESIPNDLGINVIIDYAHTPDGIKNVLETAKEFTKGRLISVFGCGGDRDRTKRPKMGAISASLADYIVITSDNPRTENELKIASEIAQSLEETGACYNVIINREKAIEHAILCAEKGDTVIIMGKGHEAYQQFSDVKLTYDDKSTVQSILADISVIT